MGVADFADCLKQCVVDVGEFGSRLPGRRIVSGVGPVSAGRALAPVVVQGGPAFVDPPQVVPGVEETGEDITEELGWTGDYLGTARSSTTSTLST